MLYGVGRQRKLPRQDTQLILVMAERFWRAQAAQNAWAEDAKKCVEYVEGTQWSATELAEIATQKRPALTFNVLRPLVFLVMGYFLNHRTDITYLPGNDGTGTAEIASALSQMSKQASENSQLPWVNSEVFLDGILGGRGYYDTRLSFDENLLGEVSWSALDPFSVYPDPGAEHYDLNGGNFVITSRMVSVDEVEFFYGKMAAEWIGPVVDGYSYNQMPASHYWGHEEITPWRRFGGEEDLYAFWGGFGANFYDWVDRSRKTIRLVDMQHWVMTDRWFFVDLHTGDKTPVPDHWGRDKVQKTLDYFKSKGYPLIIYQMKARRCRWSHLIGDVLVYNDWSPYDRFTVNGFFPYWRRGATRGLIHDLLDPQDEVNKRHSARANITGRSANGGWQYHKGSLDAQQKLNLEQFGSAPGFHMEWDSKNGKYPEPKQITPATPPIAHQQLEQESEDKIKQISGINAAALGELDSASMSGKALENRQRQSVVGIELFISNHQRTQELGARNQLRLFQQHYTEERIIRTIGADMKPETIVINQRAAEGIVRNVALGKYSVVIDESPLQRSFLEKSFEELKEMKELGMPIPDDFMVDASALGRKEELKDQLRMAREMEKQLLMEGIDPSQSGPGPGGSRVGPDGGSLPAGEPGAPPGL